jgi:DNA polymerase-3 subunit delta'
MIVYAWQSGLWTQLLQSFEGTYSPTAFLLSGDEGRGKFNLACRFAEYLLCLSEHGSCGQSCRSCQLMRSGNHPDCYLLASENGSFIKIEQVRALINQVQQTPKIAARQVVVIREAERMNTASMNALLKTLEEPQGDVIFLLTTVSPHGLPATIVSRCQHQPCRIDYHQAFEWLLRYIPDHQTAELLWRSSNCAPLLACTLFENNYLKIRDAVLLGMQNIHCQKILPIEITEQIAAWNIAYVLQSWISLLTDIWQIKYQVDKNILVNQDQIVIMKQLAAAVPLNKLEQFYRILIEQQANYAVNTSLNIPLLLDELWVRWSYLCQ